MKSNNLTIKSPIGWLRIVTENDQITAITFLDEMDENEDSFEQEPTDFLKKCVQQLTDYFEGKRQDFELEMNPKGTDFQQKVWTELQKIPYGKTISYLQLAKNLGDAKAVRAVGTANGKNPISILIPCHRVIGADGSLTGYAGGLSRKQFLLDLESKNKQLSLF